MGARPPVEVMVNFIEAHGVEPICIVLPIAPSTYYNHLAKRADPARLSDRARRDAALRLEIRRVFDETWRVYGVRKVWRHLVWVDFDVAHCTAVRLMREMGIQGIIRGKPHRATFPDKKAPLPAGQGEPRVPGSSALHALGQRFHLCRHLEGVRLCRLRHRRLRTQDSRLARQYVNSSWVCVGCP